MLELYHAGLTSCSKKARLCLKEKGLPYVSHFLRLGAFDHHDPAYLKLNPNGLVPTLVHDGNVVIESGVINEYLDEAYPEPPLMPDTPVERARCRLDELYADEIMLQALRPLMHRTGPPSPDRDRRIAQEADALIAEEGLARHYEVLEQKLAGREFFGGRLSTADIALFMSVLFSLRLGGPSLDGYPGLSAWFARLRQRPAFVQVAAEIAEADRRLSFPVKSRSA